MIYKKALTCLIIFTILFAGGWKLNHNIRTVHLPHMYKHYSSDDIQIIQSELEYSIVPFRSREYVRIIRKAKLDKQLIE